MTSPETSRKNGFILEPPVKQREKPNTTSPAILRKNGFILKPPVKKRKTPDMQRPETSKKSGFILEPLLKKRKTLSHHDNNEFNINKDTLLKALQDIEEEIGDLNNTRLRKLLKTLRRQVEGVLQKQKDEIERLQCEIRDLKKQVEMLQTENEELRSEKEWLNKNLVLAQATWTWEAHLVRFVIYSTERIHSFSRFKQMTDFLKQARKNFWCKIQENLGEWKTTHWAMVRQVREERNSLAHPSLVDLDLVKDEIPRMPPEFQEEMKHMVDITKMTASLMKFGRLASSYETSRQPPLSLKGGRKKAWKEIISWNRNFEDIDGLQNIDHKEAKRYLKKFVGDGHAIDDYFFIVDEIKKRNSKRLGKLAKDFEERYLFINAMSMEEKEALNELKKLFRARERNVTVLHPTIAKLHIPDVLPKKLWKYGLKIVDKYSNLPSKY